MRIAFALPLLLACTPAAAPAPAPATALAPALAPAPLTQIAPADAGAPEPECDRRPDMAPAIRTADARALSFCLESKECFTLDFATGAYQKQPAAKVARAANRATNARSPDGRIEATITGDTIVRGVDASGRRVFEHTAHGETLTSIRWLGASLLLEECHKDDPGCRWALFHPSMRDELALDIGGFDLAPLAFQVQGPAYAFVDGGGERVVFADTDKRAIVKSVYVGAPADGHYGVDAARTSPNEIAIVYGSPYAGRVVRVDLANARVVATYRPSCRD